MVGLRVMPHCRLSVDQVVVASSDSSAVDDAGCSEVCDDPLSRSLSDFDFYATSLA
jgi:hypothetical protein